MTLDISLTAHEKQASRIHLRQQTTKHGTRDTGGEEQDSAHGRSGCGQEARTVPDSVNDTNGLHFQNQEKVVFSFFFLWSSF
jgi:hypothetical protein